MGHATPNASAPLFLSPERFRYDVPDSVIFDLNSLAVAIADAAVRSDIECFAHVFVDTDGHDAYDLNRTQEAGKTDPESEAFAQHQVINAALYIDRRGDVFPWRMLRCVSAPHLVRFEAKP